MYDGRVRWPSKAVAQRSRVREDVDGSERDRYRVVRWPGEGGWGRAVRCDERSE